MLTVTVRRLSQQVENPTAFRPERFLEDPDLTSPSDYIFGSGRRCVAQPFCKFCDTDRCLFSICPGMYMAENSSFLFIANILARFEIRAPDEKDGGLRSLEDAKFRPFLNRSVLLDRHSVCAGPLPLTLQASPNTSSVAYCLGAQIRLIGSNVLAKGCLRSMRHSCRHPVQSRNISWH